MTTPLAYPLPIFLKLAGVGRSRFYEDLRDGRIKAKKNGSRTVITAEEAQRYIDALPDYQPKRAA